MKPRCPVANPEIAVHWEEGRARLYNPNDGEAHFLNASAAFVFSLLDGRRATDEVVDHFMSRFEVPDRATAQKDVEDLLAALKDKRLIGEVV